MEASKITDKHGNVIHEGDYVFTKIRGGTHEGKVSQKCHAGSISAGTICADWKCGLLLTSMQVEEIVTDDQRAKERSVKHPPKVMKTYRNLHGEETDLTDRLQVLLHNKDGKIVAHNPGTLEIQSGDT